MDKLQVPDENGHFKIDPKLHKKIDVVKWWKQVIKLLDKP